MASQKSGKPNQPKDKSKERSQWKQCLKGSLAFGENWIPPHAGNIKLNISDTYAIWKEWFRRFDKVKEII